MAFWVYENWHAGRHKAVIHAGRCGYCNEGKGRSGGDYDPRHGTWHGPYETQREAEAKAHSLPGVVDRKNHSCVVR